MKSMKLDKKEKKQAVEPAMAEAPDYPYGLSVHLNNDSLDKLEVKKLPSVGDTFEVRARAEVRSVSASDSGSGKNREISLQITDMEIASAEKEGKEAKSVLFDKTSK